MEEELSPDELADIEAGLKTQALSPDEESDINAGVQDAPSQPAVAPDPGPLSAVGQHALSGFFKGGLDEAAGWLVRSGTDVLPGARYRMPDGTERLLQGGADLYRAKRDEVRTNLEAGSNARPVTAFLSSLAGDVGSDAVLGALGVPVSTPAYQTVAGAISGYLGNDADVSDGVATPDAQAEALVSAGIGGGLGLVAPKVGAAAGKYILSPLASKARNVLESIATKQGNRALLDGARTMSNRLPTPDPAVLEALRSWAIRYFGTSGGAYKRLQDLAFDRGGAYGPILEGLEKEGIRGPEADALAKVLMEEYAERLRVSGPNEAIPNLFKDAADAVRKRPDASFTIPSTGVEGQKMSTLALTQAEGIKRNLQKEARYGRIEDTPLNEAKKDLASIFRQAIEDTVEKAGLDAPKGSEVANLAEDFLPIKQNLALTKQAEEAAKWGAARSANRSAVDLPSTVMAAGASGTIPQKTALAFLLSQVRQRGASTVSRGAYDASRAAGALSKPLAATRVGLYGGAALGRQSVSSDWLQQTVSQDPDALGQYGPVLSSALARGPAAFAVTDYVLSQQDPKYRQQKQAAQDSLTK
jgi:hypothetical protein